MGGFETELLGRSRLLLGIGMARDPLCLSMLPSALIGFESRATVFLRSFSAWAFMSVRLVSNKYAFADGYDIIWPYFGRAVYRHLLAAN
jgi:hypothetical protein